MAKNSTPEERISTALELCTTGDFKAALDVLEEDAVVQVLPRRFGTRCPDCNEPVCDESCPSFG